MRIAWRGRLRRAVESRDPGLTGLARALRVAVVASVAFYTCRYALGDRTMATYATFAAIAMGALSSVDGPPRARTRVYLGALATGGVLVPLGTYLARSTGAATVGMAVVGFVVAFAAVGGGRVAAVVNGLQLFYILPSFPPYAPDTLDSRLLGLALGLGLLALGDRVLLPAPAPVRYPDVLAAAAGAVAAYLETLVALLSADGDARQLPSRAANAAAAVRRARPGLQPPAVRPGAPTRRDLALTHVAAAVRETWFCAERMQPLVLAGPVGATAPLRELLAACAQTLQSTAGAVAAGTVPPVPTRLHAADAAWAGSRLRELRTGVDGRRLNERRLDERIALAGLVSEIAEVTGTAVDAAGVAAGAALTHPDRRAGLWYADRPAAALWAHRIRVNLDLRSVALRNAVRVGVALAAARLVVPALHLSHGFWVLLATLTLMRTSAADTRSALAAATGGTLAGAAAGGALLLVVGQTEVVYQLALPVVLFLALAAGPLLGPAAAQAGFTLAVVCLFVQIAPSTWRLSETRLEDVVVGGLVGAAAGLLAWPRGAGGQLRREAASCLRACAAYVGDAGRAMVGEPYADGSRLAARRELAYVESVRASALHERQVPALSGVDWQAVLVAAHRALRGGEALARRYPVAAPLPDPEATALLHHRSERVAAGYAGLAAAVERGAAFDPVPADGLEPEAAWVRRVLAAGVRDPAVLRVVDAATWLAGLGDDLDAAAEASSGIDRA